MNKVLSFIIFVLFIISLPAKAQEFTSADSVRGALNPWRTCYDVTHYSLHIRVDPDRQFIQGKNIFTFLVNEPFDTLQVDLFENMNIDSILYKGNHLTYTRKFNAVLIDFAAQEINEDKDTFTIYYSGQPLSSANPPWDGGFVWRKDKNDNPWIGVACEGAGASLWWPNKDHLSDEPDSMHMNFSVPGDLMAVSNGQLDSITENKEWKTYHWKVTYPINNYNVTVNIAEYAHFSDAYVSGKDTLDLDYYVLSYNQEKAKDHFEQVKPMMECFENYFGKYPFRNDGFALVETPYWGMEHQGAVAYGNNYRNNEWGFDYIIIHESAHEWWGNHVSTSDHAELWIHESFTTYAEALYVECRYGYEAATKYINLHEGLVKNSELIVGPLNVNYEHKTADMYYKGSLVLNTLRSMTNNDSAWFGLLYSIQEEFSMKTTSTEELTEFIEVKLNMELDWFFEQYIYSTELPEFAYKTTPTDTGLLLEYRWENVPDSFNMPFLIRQRGVQELREGIWLNPTTRWQSQNLDNIKEKELEPADELFYVRVKKY